MEIEKCEMKKPETQQELVMMGEGMQQMEFSNTAGGDENTLENSFSVS
jgi:hypothetical protein